MVTERLQVIVFRKKNNNYLVCFSQFISFQPWLLLLFKDKSGNTSDTGGLCGQADAQPRDDAAYSSDMDDIGGRLADPGREAK